MFLRRWKTVMVTLVVCGVSLAAGLAHAQTGDASWQPPVNISNSGAASQPAIAATADGVLHALWWDSALGTVYGRTTDGKGLTWSTPVSVPSIVGRRILDPQTGTETITPPRVMRLAADAAGNVYAFWYDSTDQLFSMVNNGSGWSDPVSLAEKAVQFEAVPGSGDQLHLIYIRPVDTAEGPAGVYYRSARGGKWGPAHLIDSSAYYRAIKPEQANVSVVGNAAGNTLVAWDRPPLNQSFFASSSDQGATWSAPQSVAGTDTAQARRARLASGPNNEFLMQWQDPSASGCGLMQRRSSDNGATWSAAEVVLSTLTRCDIPWSFTTDQSGRVWLISQPTGAAANVVTVAVWDGNSWSDPHDVTFAYFDNRTQLLTNLNCVNLSIAGGTAGLVGCDARNDVWGTRNAISLDQWLPSLKSVWNQPATLTAQSGPVPLDAIPNIAADNNGHAYAVWNQLTSDGSSSDLFAAVWRDGRWSSASRITTANTTDTSTASSAALQAKQPAIAADNHDRVHLVWSGSGAGEIYYTWAYVRDLGGGQRWNAATLLSPAGTLGQWPDIVADPGSTNLYVIYTLPFNEQRGVYFSASTDSGQSWQAPNRIFDAAAAGWASVDRARLAYDAENKILHAVWQSRALPGQVQPEEIDYASSSDGGKTWSTPLKVATGTVAWPQVTVPATGQVYVAWCQTDANGFNIEGQFSPDSGQRWSPPTTINQFKGASCPVSIATDGLGQMHLASVAANSGDESILLSSLWNGQSWNDPEIFRLGQRSNAANAAAIALVPQADRLSALIKIWSQPAQAESRFEVVATDRQIPAVGILQPAPTFTPMPTATASPTSTPSPTETPKPPTNTQALKPPSAGGGPPPLVLGGALAGVIVVIVVTRIIWVKRR
jgi:hypothetical protein